MTQRRMRPVLRWHGGKWRIAPWIIEHFPPHEVYCEPFGGAASVLLRKPRSFLEVYNDLDDELFNLFQVLRSPRRSKELIRLIELTPFGRREFRQCYEPTTAPIERARRMIARSFMGHGSGGALGRTTGFRANANASGAHNTAREWSAYPDALALTVERLRGVVIENAPADDLIRRADRPDALFYIDPPYVHETRSAKMGGGTLYHRYRHEMSSADHQALLAQLQGLAGMVVLSGYPSPLYERGLRGWQRIERHAAADGGRPRVEVLWLNPACRAALRRAA